MPENTLLVPASSRVLHIGPPKTGTTSVQGALRQARSALASHGVCYPGDDSLHTLAARAAVGTPVPRGDPPVDPRHWDELVRQVSEAGDRRVIVSAEAFSRADEAAVRRIVPAIGGTHAHVVVTCRPFAKLLASSWQQSVGQGLHTPYEDWLRSILGHPPYGTQPPSFRKSSWFERRRYDLLVERWAAVVGIENLTVVVASEPDRHALLRAFEHLLGLPAGLLTLPKWTNNSLSLGEAEMVRQVNRAFHERGWSDQCHKAVVRDGFLAHLHRADRLIPDDERIRTPPWAAERASQIGSAVADRIVASGVRVVGDITALGFLPQGDSATAPRVVMRADRVAAAVVGAVLATARQDGVFVEHS